MCQIEGYSVVLDVSPQFGTKRGPKGREAFLILPGARPLLDPLELRPETFPARFHFGNHRPFARSAPVEQETQKLEGSWQLSLPSRLFGEGNQLRFLLMEAQTIFGQPLPQGMQNTLRVSRILATDHRIVCVAIEGDLPSTMRFDYLFKPRIEHVMSKDIGEDGAATTALRYPFLTDGELSCCQHARFEHPLRIPHEAFVLDLLAEHGFQ